MAPANPPRIVLLAADLPGWQECGLLQVFPEAEAAELLPDALAVATADGAVLALYRPSAATLSAVRGASPVAMLVAVRPEDLPGADASAFDDAVELLVLPATTPEMVFRVGRAADRPGRAADEPDERSQLLQQSRRDDVTGLPGAWLYRDRLEHALRARLRSGAQLTVAVLRLGENRRGEFDGITPARLRSVAARVRAAIRASDTLAHEGHQGAVSRGAAAELLLLLPDLGIEDPRVVLQRIHEIATTDTVDSPAQRLPASIGYTVADGAAAGADELLQRARAALDAAATGEIRCAAELTTAEAPDDAMASDELPGPIEVWYQPILRDGGELLALEAQPRWRHPALGLLGEAELMLYALDRGLVQSVTATMLQQVCAQWRTWRDNVGEVTLALPLRGAALRQPTLLDCLSRTLGEHDMPPHALVIEVGEDDLLASPALTGALQSFGVSVALDDLGAGPTALRSVRQCAAGWLKIDADLVRRLPESAEAMSAARLLLAMARGAGVEPVAPAVESERQLRALRALGCELFQGWEVHAPAPADALRALLWRSRRAAQDARVIVPFRTSV